MNKNRHLLRLTDWSEERIVDTIETAIRLKEELKTLSFWVTGKVMEFYLI